jgi:tetratricopeptide (TPR) repeat protein
LVTELDRTIPAGVPLLERLLRALKGLYRRSLPEATRRQIRGVIFPKKVKLALRPDLIVEAKSLSDAWKLPQALSTVDKALRADPSNINALRLRASILSNMGNRELAIAATQRLLKHHPIDIVGFRQLKALGVEPPAASLRTALKTVSAMGNTSIAYVRAAEYLYFFERFDDVLTVCERGLTVANKDPAGPKKAKAIHNLLLHKGMALEGKNMHSEAIAIYESTPELAKSVGSIARCLLEIGQPAAGEAIIRRSRIGEPDPRPFTPLTMDLLQAQSKVRDAYLLYRKRPISLAIAKYFNAEQHPLDIDIMSGAYRQKKAILITEGGPGDELRMASAYPDLASHFGSLTITSDPRLAPIMSRTFPKINFLPVSRHRREIVREMSDRTMLTDSKLFQCVSDQVIIAGRDGVDLVCSLLDTLADIRPTKDSFPRNVYPLQPKPDLVTEWRQIIGSNGRLQVGFAWRSMLQTVARNRHYLKVEDLAPLSELENVDFWLLQPNATNEEIAYLRSIVNLRIPEGLDLVDDMEGQVAISSCLDIVISPFTTTGELAAATGTPTLLVSTNASTMWRRNEDGSDIWAPKTQIIWGNPIHDRLSAMQVVTDKLQARIKRRRRPKT